MKEETMTTAVRTVRSAVGGRQCKRRRKMRMRKRKLTKMRRKRRMRLRRTANTTSRQL